MSNDDLREKLAGLVRAERLLRDQEQHYAADSVADAIAHMDRCLQKSERAEELGGSLADRIERARQLDQLRETHAAAEELLRDSITTYTLIGERAYRAHRAGRKTVRLADIIPSEDGAGGAEA